MQRSDALTLIGVIILLACAGIVLAQPLWVSLAARWGKRRAWLVATTGYASVYLVWSFSAAAGPEAAYLLPFFAAVGNSGWAMLGFAMLSDIAAENETRGGLYSAVWIALDKIGFALGGTLLAGFVLALSGFDSALAVSGAAQPATVVVGIQIGFGVIPAALNFAAVAIFWRWGRDTGGN